MLLCRSPLAALLIEPAKEDLTHTIPCLGDIRRMMHWLRSNSHLSKVVEVDTVKCPELLPASYVLHKVEPHHPEPYDLAVVLLVVDILASRSSLEAVPSAL